MTTYRACYVPLFAGSDEDTSPAYVRIIASDPDEAIERAGRLAPAVARLRGWSGRVSVGCGTDLDPDEPAFDATSLSVEEPEEAPVTTATGDAFTVVKVRLAGEKRFRFIAPNGGTLRLAIHAEIAKSEADAIACAESILADERNTNVEAVAVVTGDRRVFHKLRAGCVAPRRLRKRDREDVKLLNEAQAFLDQITDDKSNAAAIDLADRAITRVSWVSGSSNTPNFIRERATELHGLAHKAWKEATYGTAIAGDEAA